METIRLNKPDLSFIREVEAESGEVMNKCYQCGNCTAGCPMGFTYDYSVTQVMRLIQAGQKNAVLSSRSIWMCVTCETCTQRCPNEIDVATIMDVCRHMARREGKRGVYTVRTFADSFIQSVKMNGRVHEIGLMMMYMLKTGRVWTDVELSPKVMPKGKMAILPHRTKNPKEVADIITRFKEGASDEAVVRANLAAKARAANTDRGGAAAGAATSARASQEENCAPGATPFGMDASTTKLPDEVSK